MTPDTTRYKRRLAFTLAELLVALLVLGIIAAFTIPKVLQTQANQRYNAEAKEVMANISDIYRTMQLQGQITANTHCYDLVPYLNYVAVDTTDVLDWYPGGVPATRDCSDTASNECYKLHNGGVLWTYHNESFGGGPCTSATCWLSWGFDPDASVSATKMLPFALNWSGGVQTATDCTACEFAGASNDPSWWTEWR